LAVSFNLDQLVEGIENKEPDSPTYSGDEYIEEECKFLPPPKTKIQPRLFFIKNDEVTEYFNQEQLDYTFRNREKNNEILKYKKTIKI